MNALVRRLGRLVRRLRAARDLRRALHQECPVTKADLRKAIIKTAALAHWHHSFGGRVLRTAINDNLSPAGRTTGSGAANASNPCVVAPGFTPFHAIEVSDA